MINLIDENSKFKYKFLDNEVSTFMSFHQLLPISRFLALKVQEKVPWSMMLFRHASLYSIHVEIVNAVQKEFGLKTHKNLTSLIRRALIRRKE